MSAEDHYATFHFHDFACAQDDYVEVILASDTMPNHKMTFALTAQATQDLAEELCAAASSAGPQSDTHVVGCEPNKDRDRRTP